MTRTRSSHLRKGILILAAVFALLLFHPAGFLRQEVFAAPGTVRTSTLTPGTNYDFTADTILLIDESITIGKIFTGNAALTIRGNDDAVLTVTRIASASSSSNKKPITMESGTVRVSSEYTTEQNKNDYQAVYSSFLFHMKGGKLKINIYRGGVSYPVLSGISTDTFRMTGGELTIEAGTADSMSAYGLDIFGKESASEITGGTLKINAEDQGINLGEHSHLSVSGGSVTVNAGAGVNKGCAVEGKYSSSLAVNGGTFTVEGGAYGLSGMPCTFSGNARVRATGRNSYGIQVKSIEVKDRAVVNVKGAPAAIITNKNGISIDDTYHLYIEIPAGGYTKNEGSYQSVYNTYGKQASLVHIDYLDAVGTISVAANPSEVTKGKETKVVCTATVTGYSHNELAVAWSVFGNSSSNTKIASNGILTVAADETAGMLVVRGVTTADTTKTAEAVIYLIDPPETTDPSSGTSGSSTGETESGTPSGGSTSGGDTGSGSGNSGSGSSSGGKSEEDKILAGVKKEDAAAIKNPKGPKKITQATVNKLPVNKKLGTVKAAKIITKGSLKKKTMTVYYNKVKGASNYIIAWKKAKAKKWNYYTTGNQGSYVIHGLKRKNLVQFKIAPYAKGKRGPWSATKYRYFENAAVKAVRKGASITVTFKKVKGATGYQLLYARSKTMKGYKIRSVKGKNKIVLKKLNKKAVWYIRWRPYKIYKGKKYIGILKNTKAMRP